jgi:hypothetical protein
MNTTSREEALGAVPLANAVFCVNCETINNSPHDECTICGSHSLISLFRVLGGTLRSQKRQSTGDKYSLEVTAKVHEISAVDFNVLIELLTRLVELGGAVESLHLNVEPVIDPRSLRRAG